MIGQKRLIEDIKQLAEGGDFPQFLILVGPKGSGKKLVADRIASFLHLIPMHIGTSVADIRLMIETARRTGRSTISIIADADNMSNEAKNAMLKIVEEPPKDVYFIMTLEDINNTLATIKSRAFILYMDRYTPDEISDYAIDKYNAAAKGSLYLAKNLCDTPGEVDTLMKVDAQEFSDYVDLVIDNIADVGTSNALKIGDKVALKEGVDGYDLKLFWKLFIDICLKRAQGGDIDTALQYASGASITSKFLAELRVRGINKQMLFLDWILRIRKEWN